LLARIDQRLDLLRANQQDTPARHATLRDAIAWSYDLLTHDEQRMFGQLAVFGSSWTLEAAEAIVGPRTLEWLSALVDRHLVTVIAVDPDPEPRFRFPENIAAFADERLAVSDFAEATRGAHAQYFADFAARADRELEGPEQELWVRRLADEHANTQVAFRWFVDQTRYEQAVLLLRSLVRFAWFRGHLAELRSWADVLVVRESDLSFSARAQLLYAAGFAALMLGEYDRASTLLERALGSARRAQDIQTEGQVLLLQAYATPLAGEFAQASALFRASQERLVAARDTWAAGFAVIGLAEFAILQGDVDSGRSLVDDFLHAAYERGDVRSIAIGLEMLGTLSLVLREWTRAARALSEAAEMAYRMRDVEVLAYCLRGLATIASARQQWASATRLFAAIDRMWQPLGLAGWPVRHEFYAGAVQDCRIHLGNERFGLAWAEGERLSMDATVQAGLAVAAATSYRASLTRREHEVAALIARGLTSQQIAEALVISVRTADTHASHIRAKLGLHSRAEIAAHVVEESVQQRLRHEERVSSDVGR
jgi:non-specific serine/threonine protein kinase